MKLTNVERNYIIDMWHLHANALLQYQKGKLPILIEIPKMLVVSGIAHKVVTPDLQWGAIKMMYVIISRLYWLSIHKVLMATATQTHWDL